MIGCIYIMTSPSEKVYIGQTRDLHRRYREYLNIKCKRQRKLYYSLLKYGFESHDFNVIEFCSESELNDRERYWQDKFESTGPNGLNLKLTTSKDRSGKLSNEVKSLISSSNIGKHNHTDEVRKVISLANKGKVISERHRRSNSTLFKIKFLGSGNPFYGMRHSESEKKASSDRVSGGNNPKAKTILDLESGVYYETLTEFAKHKCVSNPTAIIKLNQVWHKKYKVV